MAEEVQARQILRETYRTMAEYFLGFLDVSAGSILYRRGLGKKRLQRAFDVSSSALNEAMVNMAAEGEDCEETALTVLWKYKRELAGCGFDFDAETAKHAFKDRFDETWHNAAEKSKHYHRSQFAERMKVATQVHYASLLDYAHSELGYGRGRLERLYADLRADYNEFLGAYLMCKQRGDDRAKAMITERQKLVEKVGLTLIEAESARND